MFRFKMWSRAFRRWWRPVWPASRAVHIPEYTSEEKCAMLRALAGHPGFQWLMADMESKRAAIAANRATLLRHIASNVSAETVIREVIRDDEALHWTGYLQHLVRRAEAMPELTDKVSRP